MTRLSILFATVAILTLPADRSWSQQAAPTPTPAATTPPSKAGALSRLDGWLRRRTKPGAPAPATSIGALDPSSAVDISTSTPMPALTPQKARGVHLDLGRVSEVQGRLAEAADEYRKALAVEPGRGHDDDVEIARAHRKLAAVLDRQGKFSESAPHYAEALRLAPKDARAWNDAGYSAYLQGRFGEAQAHLRRAASLAPDDPRVRTNLGLALAAGGDDAGALDTLTRASGPAAAHLNLGYVLASTGRVPAARDQYRAALRYEPKQPLALDALTRLDTPPDRGPVTGNTALAPDRSADAQVARASAPARPEPKPSAPPIPATLPPILPPPRKSERASQPIPPPRVSPRPTAASAPR